MLYPEINTLRDRAGSRYYLVVMAAKRARDIIDGKEKLDPRITTNKAVSIAAEEIAEGYFTYRELNEMEIQEQERAAHLAHLQDDEDDE